MNINRERQSSYKEKSNVSFPPVMPYFHNWYGNVALLKWGKANFVNGISIKFLIQICICIENAFSFPCTHWK